MIYRQLIEDLEKWSQRPNRKPLVLRGARQVGKTTLIDEFGKLQFIGLIGGRILTWGRRVPPSGRQIAVYSVNKYVKFGRRSVFIVYLYEFSHILFKKEE